MKIRAKLLTLLLLIAVTPLVINSAVNHYSMYSLGRHLATKTRTLLTEDAHAYLQTVVMSFQTQQERNRKMLEIALSQQAQEWMLQQHKPPTDPQSPNKAYQMLQDYLPDLIVHQFTIFESGRGTCYPDDDTFARRSDLLQLPWYQATRDSRMLTLALATDPVTGQPALILATPLKLQNGSIAGIAAVSRSVAGLFQELKLPQDWSRKAKEMLVVLEKGPEDHQRLRIVAVHEEQVTDQNWLVPGQGDELTPDDPAETNALLEVISAGKAATLRIKFRGQETHWVFGRREKQEPFPLIIVPHAGIISEANATEQHVLAQTLQGLKISGTLLGAVVLVVVILAFFFARRVTLPLSRLADAAKQLAAGDYQARTEINTGDELGDLGRIFNSLGPQLQERQRLAHSLALAGEIQQNLLPQIPPALAGFDIFGQGSFCDETGGDYFDFIPLSQQGKIRLGLAVGDVSGHGISSALLMASARGILRSQANRYDTDLGGLFAEMNRHLSQDTGDDRFMTLFYGVLNTSDRSLLWNSAGHGPVLWYRMARKVVEEIPSTGIPLGMLGVTDYPPAGPIVMDVGDVLLIGTDGIWETRSPSGDMFGTRHLKELMSTCTDQSARGIYSTIVNNVSKFRAGGPLEDDLTLVVVKVKGLME